jgi:restriction endonuclease
MSPLRNLPLTQKKKLLSLAKQLDAAIKRKQMYAQQGNNLLRTSEISVREMAYPTTAASRNVVRRLERLESMMNYSHDHLVRVAQRLLRNFPNFANNSHENIIRKTSNSIRRHQTALRAVHTGRYQTVGRSALRA